MESIRELQREIEESGRDTAKPNRSETCYMLVSSRCVNDSFYLTSFAGIVHSQVCFEYR